MTKNCSFTERVESDFDRDELTLVNSPIDLKVLLKAFKCKVVVMKVFLTAHLQVYDASELLKIPRAIMCGTLRQICVTDDQALDWVALLIDE